MNVLYVRVSSGQQEKKYSPEAQKRELVSYAKKWGFTEHIIVTEALTGKEEGYEYRIKLQEAVEQLQEGDHFIVTEENRLARESRVFNRIEDKIFKKGGIFHTTKINPEDVNDPRVKLTQTVMGGVAQYELEEKTARTKRSRRVAKEDGIWMGRVPYGYRSQNTILRTDEEEYNNVMTIFQMKLDKNYSAYKIGLRLGLSLQKVQRILSNLFYAGYDIRIIQDEQRLVKIKNMPTVPITLEEWESINCGIDGILKTDLEGELGE